LILIIGGRSKVGAALISELLGRGQQVRALVRAGEAASGLPAAAGAVTGDLADEGSLVTAMEGVEKVFLLSSPHPDAISWHRNAIDAARRTQVQLLVRSSIFGADRESTAEFISAHTTCDRYLEDSGLPHVIVRPNLFLQNIPESTIPSIDASGTFYVNAGDARISMADTRDVAAVAAVALTEPGHTGAAYDITGPEALSYAHQRDGTPYHLHRCTRRCGPASASGRRTERVVRQRARRLVSGLPPVRDRRLCRPGHRHRPAAHRPRGAVAGRPARRDRAHLVGCSPRPSLNMTADGGRTRADARARDQLAFR
jgi:uncharacterized protein YbjT (DUF2867 family)